MLHCYEYFNHYKEFIACLLYTSISDFYRVVGERLSPKGDIEEEGVLTQEEFAAHMMENPADFYYGVLWNKLYRRDLVLSLIHIYCSGIRIRIFSSG